MKKLLLSSVLCLLSSVLSPLSSASLVDMTPGGFNPDNGLPAIASDWLRYTFFDEAAHGFFSLPEGRTYLDGWVNRYGLVNGADFFTTDLFGHDESVSNISWNMAGFPGGYWLSMVGLSGVRPDGTQWSHLYLVRAQDRFNGSGIVTVDGNTTIMGIDFKGTNQVPEGGNALYLYLSSVLCLLSSGLWKRFSI